MDDLTIILLNIIANPLVSTIDVFFLVKRVISAKGTRVVVSKQKCKKVASEKQPLTEDLSNPTVSPSLGKRKG